jgi:hypothetical protein
MDGGFDFSIDFDNQEINMTALRKYPTGCIQKKTVHS